MRLNVTHIKVLMAEQRLTQTDLASRGNLSRQSVSTILTRGTCEPKTAGVLAQALGVPVIEIVASE